MPADWPSRRAEVLRRDGYACQLRLRGCQGAASDVDHIVRGNDHRLENLQAACTKCHAKKSSAEGIARQRQLRARRYRPTERHPGSLR
ncbi:HNH endonuclease [Nocardia sp. IFM 10818]